jgi:DNA-binding MarR family transcriptional regulator
MNGTEKVTAKSRDLAAVAQEIELNLRELRRMLRKPLREEVARASLTWPQRNAMQVLVLVHSDGLSLKELSKRMGLAHATVSGIVDRLEKRGLVERSRDSLDGRFTRIVVSNPVRKFMTTKLRALMTDPLQEALHRATPAERRTIREGLRTLRRVMAADSPELQGVAVEKSGKASRAIENAR